MDEVRIQRVIKVGTSLAVVLPVNVCRALCIQRGDRVAFGVFEDNTLVVRKLTEAEVRALRPQQFKYGK